MADPSTDIATAASPQPPPLPDMAQPDKLDKAYQGALKELAPKMEQKIGADAAAADAMLGRQDRYRKQMEQMSAAEGASLDELKHPWNAEQELSKHQTSLWEAFGSPGFIVAMVGSAFSAMPMNSALASGGAAIEAKRRGDMAGYEMAYQAWKDNTELTMKRLRAEHDAFADIDHLRGTNLADWRAKAEAALMKFNNQRGLALLRQGMVPELMESVEKYGELESQLGAAKMHIQQQDLYQRLLTEDDDWKSGDAKKMMRAATRVEYAMQGVNGAKLSPDQEFIRQWQMDPNNGGKTTEEYSKAFGEFKARQRAIGEMWEPGQPPPGMSKEQFDDAAETYRLTGQLPNYGWGKDAGAYKRAIVNHSFDLAREKGESVGDTIARRMNVKSLGAALTKMEGQKAAIESFENNARMQGQVLVGLADKVDQTGVPTLERWLRSGRREVQGDTDVTKFNTQMQIYSNEVARILSNPNLTGVLTDHARAEMKNFLDGASTATQVRDVVKLLENDMDRREGSIDYEIESLEREIAGKPQPERPGGAPAAAKPKSNFDRDAAKKAGYSDKEIDDYLTSH